MNSTQIPKYASIASSSRRRRFARTLLPGRRSPPRFPAASRLRHRFEARDERHVRAGAVGERRERT
jgi:hypothetical protein